MGDDGRLDYRRMPKRVKWKWGTWVLAAGFLFSSFGVGLTFSGCSPERLGGGIPQVEQVAGGIPQGGAAALPPAQDNFRWGLKAINAPVAWEITQGTADVVVAVIDSGIDHRVPQLAAVMWRNPGEIASNGLDDDDNGYVDDVFGWDFRDNDPSSVTGTPAHWHGTFVASLIAAELDIANNTGGVAPKARIMDLRFLDSHGLFYSRDWPRLIQAIDYAVANGARIINLSLYSKVEPPTAVHRALQRAMSAGVLVVGIAGNAGTEVGYFGKWPEVMAVGASDEEGLVAAFSNRGPEVALVGPGVKVTAHGSGGIPRISSGTSFAAPHVTGTAALILALRPTLSPNELVRILQRTASYLEEERFATGAGLVNAAAAVEYVLTSVLDGKAEVPEEP